MKNILARGGIEFLAVLLGITISLWIDKNNQNSDLNNEIEKVHSVVELEVSKLISYTQSRIEVYAKQFAWQARYAGADNTLGLGNVNFIDETNNPIGVDMSHPASLDDKPVTELHLPKGKKVLFKFRSQDVLHSAYMPHFRAQMNCVPGMVTQFAFTPKYTTEEMREQSEVMDKVRGINKIRSEKGEDLYEFDYVLLCNKICGASHYSMQMKIVVEEEEDYKQWLAEQPTFAEKL